MRILHAHKYFHERDGAGRYMLSLMRALDARGHVTAPFAMHDPRNMPSPWSRYFVSTLPTERAHFGISAFRQTARAFWSREAATHMRAMLHAFRPDIVHAHNMYTHLSPSILAECRRADVPVVITVHDYALVSANYALWAGDHALTAGKNSLVEVVRSRFMKGSLSATFMLECITRLQRMLHMYDRNIVRYIAPSQFVKDVLVEVGYDAARIDVVHPFVIAPSSPVRNTIGTDVLFVGRLETYKGVATLLTAARMMPHVHFRIIGDGPQRARLESAAKDLRNVRFDGFLSGEKLCEAYDRARVLVVPSLWYEPFGLVALEAMARGVPVIVTDRGGLPEIVGDEEGGIVVPAGDEGKLQGVIEGFFEDEKGATDMGRRAKKRVEMFFSQEVHVDRILAIYRAIL